MNKGILKRKTVENLMASAAESYPNLYCRSLNQAMKRNSEWQ